MSDNSSSDKIVPRQSVRWYFARDGAAIGPMAFEAIQTLLNAGELKADTLVVQEGKEDLESLSDVLRMQHEQSLAANDDAIWRTGRDKTAPPQQLQATPPAVAGGEAQSSSPQHSGKSTSKPCPMCGEEILAVAKKCKHCGEYLDASLQAANKPQASTTAAVAEDVSSRYSKTETISATWQGARAGLNENSNLISGLFLGGMFCVPLSGVIGFLLIASGFIAAFIGILKGWSSARKGPCPQCGKAILHITDQSSIDCPACKKRVHVQEDRFVCAN